MSRQPDAFEQNIAGVQDLIESGVNKSYADPKYPDGVGELTDVLDLPMSDEELISLKDEWESKNLSYVPKVEKRQERNKLYYSGKQRAGGLAQDAVIPSNLIFEAQETFIPQALSKNPEPVVWSDNTEEGKAASNDIKTMLQYHADTLCLRKKLGVMVRHWSIYFIGIMKHGWDAKTNDIKLDIRNPKNFVFDPEGFIDEFGNYNGSFLGERIKKQAKDLIEMFPKHKAEIIIACDGKLGTYLVYTEWWTDEYCFSTFRDIVLDKHKNEFFNYDKEEPVSEEDQQEYGMEPVSVTPGKNHFAVPKMPYTFLSVFSLQEQPHDITNLIEQSIANQDRITERDLQIDKNLRNGNNSIAVSGISFNKETARQAAQALEDGDPVLVPDGQVDNAIKRIPANDIPAGVFNSLQIDKDTLRSVFGVQGLAAQPPNEQQTARGMILNQSHDTTRIGGGIGDALEQVADNVFNWWLQLYYVFYDEVHYGAIVGSGSAVEFVGIINSNLNRQFVVSVTPDSMQPKDEISEMNLAMDLANKGWLDPINLFKRLNYPDPMETAKMVTLFRIDPMAYMQQFFPENAPMIPGAMPGNPPDMQGQVAQPPGDETLAAPPASASLSQVPINQPGLPA